MLTIIPTIDVEGVHGSKPFQQMVLGEIEGISEDWGVFRLAEIFARHSAPATFFVDVYEESLWGEELLRSVCSKLSVSGFDVQLHTHPGWRDDPHDFDWLRLIKQKKSFLSQEKDFMAKLTVQEQYDLIMFGLDRIESWTGERPVAHRSGGYSLNEDTIKALQNAGVALDSSMHWGHQNSKISWSKNGVVEQGSILEIPITLIDYVFSLPGIGVLYRKSMKTDLDTCSLGELLAYVDQAQNSGLKVMNLFMHSYSLLEFDQDYRQFKPQPRDEEKLIDFLSAVNKMSDVRVLDCATALKLFRESPDQFKGPDLVPEVQVNIKIIKLAAQKLMNNCHDLARRFIRVGN
jgi:peptidoglycan/xylan/chitin deacetylase (PgdA/CDA1 family)